MPSNFDGLTGAAIDTIDYEPSRGANGVVDSDYWGDGYDEIVYGGCTIDHNGSGLYSSNLGHGDALHVGDFLPDTPGLEIWSCCECAPYGAVLRKAATGETIFRWTASGDTGRAIAGNFIDGN